MDSVWTSKLSFFFVVNTINFLFFVWYRALIFPLLIREGKPTPFFTFVLALLFCVFNGYMQGRSLTTYATYPPGWLGDSRFITGELNHGMRTSGVIFLCLHSS